jgi:hypothetical protein
VNSLQKAVGALGPDVSVPADQQAARRARVAAVRAQARRCAAGLRAGEALYPAGEWAAREREALNALRALTAFLHLHPNDPVAQAIASELADPAAP